jgi:hypothetical protein
MWDPIGALAAASLVLAVLCAAWIAFDEVKRPQHMGIMDVVWPVTALYSGPIGLWAYLSFGRAPPAAHRRHASSMVHMRHRSGEASAPHPAHNTPARDAPARNSANRIAPSQIAKSALHCGAGCTVGDLLAEMLLALAPGIALALGWRTLWQDRIYSAWILAFILAFAFGILFQYLAIRPMNPEMSARRALIRALQADTLSLTAWQVGMYAVMGAANFWIFPALLGVPLIGGSLTFFWVMQFAMMAGFLTTYPVNRWLIARGIKEAM